MDKLLAVSASLSSFTQHKFSLLGLHRVSMLTMYLNRQMRLSRYNAHQAPFSLVLDLLSMVAKF